MAGGSLFLVDDDAAVRRALKFAFELDGYRVETFPDGESLARRARLPADHACLVVDYELPGMDGLALIETLRRRSVRLPAVLITTHPTAKIRQRAQAAGVDIVEKPLLSDALGRAIEQAVATH